MNHPLRKYAVALLSVAGIVTPVVAAEHTETVKRSFTLSEIDGLRTLVVDNVLGSIAIEGSSGDAVDLTLTQTFSAETSEELARARREVELEVEERPGKLELIQGGSWRCPDRGRGADGKRRHDYRCDQDDRHYEVRFDWTLRVPKEIDLEVSNVNEGAVRITGIAGRLEVSHVNDDVTIERVAGRVDARTVNGALKVGFAAKPAADCRFGTVNGDIDLTFPAGFGAELSFATLNGEVYTDFPFVRAKLPATSEHSTSGSRHRHELGRSTAATIGGGGIGLQCNTVNGNIYIRERS